MQGSSEPYEGGRKLPLVEEFYSIQGEGTHTGKPAYFIRIGGCDIGCSWCDTKFSWDPSIHPLVPAEQIAGHAASFPARSVVVTGGEPLMADLDYLTGLLRQKGLETYLETSGVYPLTGSWDWICFSPKRNAPPLPEFHEHAHELKVIISEQEDFGWAEENAEKVRDGCKLFLQPEWSRREEVLPRIIAYVKEHPRWTISLQAHKYMQIP
ncbi:MAG: 7-carboxy-7-deazaguanine synthase QueE [Bacteroidales bacterium]